MIPAHSRRGCTLTIRYRRLKTTDTKSLSKDDAVFLAEAPVLFLGALLLREENWRKLTYVLERIKHSLAIFSTEKVEAAVKGAIPKIDYGADLRDFALRHAAGRTEHHMQVLKAHQPGGWRKTISMEGEENVCAALDQGRGAILWVAHFCFNALAAKKAFHDHGYKVWHVSRPEHGFSKSRFGIATINPIRVYAELSFLGGRIIIDRKNPGKAKEEARQLLHANQMISITAGAWEGRRIATTSLLGGEIELATGATSLALQNNAALLPVFTVRDDAIGVIRVVVGPRIADPGKETLEEKIDLMTQTFIDQMKPYVIAHPEQWRDWKGLKSGG